MDHSASVEAEHGERPRVLIKIDMLRPGDVILSRGRDLQSVKIAKFDTRRILRWKNAYSHAAVVENVVSTYESDGTVIGHRNIRMIGHGYINGRRENIGYISGNPKFVSIYRHPELENLPKAKFEAALKVVKDLTYGQNYSEVNRLVVLAKLPLPELLAKPTKNLLIEIVRNFERKSLHNKIPGQFCSEIVASIYQEMGLPLCGVNRVPASISPNDLAKSTLANVDSIITSWHEIERFEVGSRTLNFGDIVVGQNSDWMADRRNHLLQIKRSAEVLELYIGRIRLNYEDMCDNANSANMSERTPLGFWIARAQSESGNLAIDMRAMEHLPMHTHEWEEFNPKLINMVKLWNSAMRCNALLECLYFHMTYPDTSANLQKIKWLFNRFFILRRRIKQLNIAIEERRNLIIETKSKSI
ncbi:hypothetical protein [Methylobacterium oryzisoli]|uniref:hypothetical protein n=1 Tax=Methylobacterium oryzisoli TaxID=3385502 RepID=UPI003892C2F5